MTTRSSPREPLRIGMIGGGFMARVHTRAARAAGGRPTAIASSSLESATRAAEELGYERAAADPLEVIADERVDIVHICAPNATHFAYARAALAAGKHVICEKPLATSVAEADELAALAERTGLVATVPFVYRFHPMARETRSRISDGSVGELLTFQGVYLQDWLLEQGDDDWRVDAAVGGPSRAFADIGSHLVDLLEFTSGARIRRIAGRGRTVHASRAHNASVDTEDAVAIVAEMDSGAVGTLLVSQVSPGRKNHLVLELAGRTASVRFEQERPDELWLGRRDGSITLSREAAHLGHDAQRLSVLPAGHPLGYQDAFSAFVADSYAAVAGTVRPGLPTFRDGARAAAVTAAVLRASEADGWIDVTATTSPASADARVQEVLQ